MKAIIIYYSKIGGNYFRGAIRSIKEGNTAVVAKKLEALLNAPSFELKPTEAYPDDYMKCVKVAKEELDSHVFPKYLGEVDVSDFDTIYLGYPCWYGTYPRVVATFLKNHDLKGKTIKPFCTNEGSGMGQSESDLRNDCPESVLAKGLSIFGSDADKSGDLLKDWIKQ